MIQDPAAGTGGFLIGADEFVRRTVRGKRKAYKPPILTAMENVPDTHRLLLMNLMLHEIDTSGVHLGDTLSEDFRKLPLADLILSNPPFGPAGRRPSRDDLQFTGAVSNFQLPFVEHCLNALKLGGRAAIVVPDNVLFEEGRARDLRTHMLDAFHLHTILRLPIGIFYAVGVKTNVLFLTRPRGRKRGATWVYDLRNNMPNFGKSTPFEQLALADFLQFYGRKSDGSDRPNAPAEDTQERFRAFSREMLAERDDNLDLSWLRESSSSPEEELTDPADIAEAIAGHLAAAMAALERVSVDLSSSTRGPDGS